MEEEHKRGCCYRGYRNYKTFGTIEAYMEAVKEIVPDKYNEINAKYMEIMLKDDNDEECDECKNGPMYVKNRHQCPKKENK